MKTVITKEIQIDMGHRVPNHKSKCRNPHGHRYKIVVGITGEVSSLEGDSDEGMIMDYGDIKTILMDEIDAKFDHGFMVAQSDPLLETFKQWQSDGLKIIIVPFVPTAENIASYFFTLLGEKFSSIHMSLEYVEVWETPTSKAICSKSHAPRRVSNFAARMKSLSVNPSIL
jgi:6-pyruvoyltetrahydropterin/6-carboxytetrahydropterin synthase